MKAGRVRPPGARGALLATLLLSTFAAAEAQEAPPGSGAGASTLEDAAWLAGCWRAESPDGRDAVEEIWMAPRGGLMVGMSRSVRGGEARGYEFLTIRSVEGTLVYHAEPSGQSPTNFPAREVGERRLEFVNPVHDFPRKIVYEGRSDGTLVATVFETVEARNPAFGVTYRPVECPGG